MSDPFERLRGSHADHTAPDVAVIKSRARRIVRRRYAVLGTGATAILVVALFGVVTGPAKNIGDLAQDRATEERGASGTTDTSSDSGASSLSGGAGSAKSDATAAPAPEAAGDLSYAPAQPGSGASTVGGRGSSIGVPNPVSYLSLTIDVDHTALEPHSVNFTLKVCNTSSKQVTIYFDDAQRYDFDVKRADDLVWRWSRGRAFAQVTGTEEWAPKECKKWSETWDGRDNDGMLAGSGSYDAVGTLTGREGYTPPVSTKPKSFCLDVC